MCLFLKQILDVNIFFRDISKVLLNVSVRFLVFYDDGLTAYLALPDFHVVCKQSKRFSFIFHFSLCLINPLKTLDF